MPERIAQLSAAMAVGDAEAVDAFYREYFDWMYGQARRVTHRDESFCLDVVQDAVLRVIRTVKPVDEEGRFRGWLQLVVKTTAFDLLRSERRRKNREAMAGVVAATVEPDADSLQLDWLQEQITRLDPEIVKIIELRFEQSWTLRRIGQRLGVSIGAVDGRLRRALTHLRLAAEESPAQPAVASAGPIAEPKQQPDEAAATGAAAAIALDASLRENVDVIAAPVAALDPSVIDTAQVNATVETAEAVVRVDAEPQPAAGNEAVAEPQSSVDAAPDAPIAMKEQEFDPAANVDVIAAPVAALDPLVIDTATVSAAIEQAEAVVHVQAESPNNEVNVLPPVVESLIEAEAQQIAPAAPEGVEAAEIGQPRIEPGISQPAVAARAAVADAGSNVSDYAVAVQTIEPPQAAVGLMEYPELVGLEDEAGWYDDVL